MKTIQCTYPPPPFHNGFVATCRLWMASGGVHALLVLEPTACSTSTRQGARIYIYHPLFATNAPLHFIVFWFSIAMAAECQKVLD